MAESHLFSLVIADQRVTAARLSVEKRGLKIVSGDSVEFADQSELTECVAKVIETCDATALQCRLALGPEFFFFRTIKLPFSDKKQVESILPFEIQDNVSLDEGEYIFDYLITNHTDQGATVLAVLLRKEIIRELLGVFASYSLDPEVISISGVPGCHNASQSMGNTIDDGYMISLGSKHSGVYILENGGITLIRSIPVDPDQEVVFIIDKEKGQLEIGNPENVEPVLKNLSRTLHNTVVANHGDRKDSADDPWYIGGVIGSNLGLRSKVERFLLLGDNARTWRSYYGIAGIDEFLALWPRGHFDETLALACCPSRNLQDLNFRKDEFARRYDRSRLYTVARAGGIVLLGLALLLIAGLTIDYQQMKKERDQLVAEITEVYKETVPDSGRIVNPLQQLQVKVNELKNATSTGATSDPSLNTLVLLGDISQRIPASLKVTFQRYIYDRKSIRIKGLTDNFNTVDQMKRSLDKSPYFNEVAIVSANVAPKDDGVRFELKLQM